MIAPAALRSVLIVDDEPMVLHALRSTLEREGFPVVACSSPLKALAILAERAVAVIISDQKMPEMSGLDFLVECRRLQPQASRILITAVLALPTVIEAINKGEIFRFVAKPWLREELVATVHNAVQRHELSSRNDVLQAQTEQLNAQLLAANSELEARVRDLEQQQQQLDGANADLQSRYENTVELCQRVLNAYDPILGGQTRTLVALATRMAATEHFDDRGRRVLRSAAWLCDLGLIGVSRELLRSFRAAPGRLTDRERATLENHPLYSQTLAALVDPSAEIGETIRAHHERFDGTGYPDRLAGSQIPWPARCLAVAVAFVESGGTKQVATESLLNQSGKAFDPEAVRLLLKVTQAAGLPRQVREILFDELEPGMVLANGIYSPHGLLLVGEGQALAPATIGKIRSHNRVMPINQRLLVYT